MEGVPYRLGSRAFRDHIAGATDWTTQRYLDAGLIVCGRTNTPEFGNHCATEPLLFGPTLNHPWDGELSCGGSSCGSAVAGRGGASSPRSSGGRWTGSIPRARVVLRCRRAEAAARAQVVRARCGGASLAGLVNEPRADSAPSATRRRCSTSARARRSAIPTRRRRWAAARSPPRCASCSR